MHLESDNNETRKCSVVITWLHIGDRNAHKYLVYLNGNEIHCVRCLAKFCYASSISYQQNLLIYFLSNRNESDERNEVLIKFA